MSTWYSDGTIEVAEGGDVAAGTGTAFLANVRVGDGIAIAGSATLHEVTNIASNQQLTFQPPFAGQAGSALAYRIAPVQGYVKRAADRLAQVVAEYGAALAALGDEETRSLVIELTENITPAGIDLMGKATAAEQRQVLSLDRVDNTPDAEKPVSAPQLQALDAKADAEDVATSLAGKADADQTVQALAGKVDKEAGKGLSHNDLTDELYNKLSTIEGSRWQGVYTSLPALATAKPTGEPGWFAWVDAGAVQPVKMAIWDIDDQQWRISSGEGGTMTPAQVLEALKANPDVNVLTDAQLAKVIETQVFSQADKGKLDSVDAGAQKNPELVGQAEAEAGTGTSIRGWPVVRVWQSAAAWFVQSGYKKRLDESLPALNGTLGGITNKIFFNFPGVTDAQLTSNGIYAGALEIREVNQVTQSKAGHNDYAPGITFNYGGYAVNKLWMDKNGALNFGGQKVLVASDVQRGSNVNGEFVKFPDGTLICTGVMRMPAQAISTDNIVTLNFPAAFVSPAYNLQLTPKTVIGSGSQDAIGSMLYNGMYTGSYGTSSMTVASYAYRSAVSNPIDFYFTVTGRWK